LGQCVYLNDVPYQNADGSTNFVVNGLDFRYGEVDQTYIPGFAGSGQETAVNTQLTQSVPWTVVVEDMTINQIWVTLGVTALSETDSSTGDVNGYEVDYQIQVSVDGGAYQASVTSSFSGKASSAYDRTHKIPLSGAKTQYSIRVVRTTPDTTSVYIQDTTQVVSYTLVVDSKLTYPCSALAMLSVDAVQFSSLPTRSYDLEGLIINVPSNYDPVARTYGGTWDGTFKQAWTNNPAWIFYDLVINNRYGAGRWINANQIDRYGLYTIAQYCDQMVDDGTGAGTKEPRFTCNCYIASQNDCFKVLQDIASVFRGMAYWGAGQAVATADMPQDPVYVYTQANVIGGQFKYVGSSLKNRYTAAVVTWNNPANAYKQEPEYVEDATGIARYGLNQAQITAFGCTSRGQAQRVGQWTILTSRYETNTVTFSVGLDGTLCQPGQIIAVADAGRAGKRIAGRLNSVQSTSVVTLDKAMDGATTGDTLTVIMPDGTAAQSTVSSIDDAQITVSPAFATLPVAGGVWMMESGTLESQLFRVTSVTEKDGYTFEIVGTQYEPGKYAAIDDGAAMDVRPVTGNTYTTQLPPSGVTCAQYIVTDQGIAKTNLTISWVSATGAQTYKVQWQKDNGSWVDAGTTSQLSLDVANVYTGQYMARVLATNGMGISSVYAYSVLTAIQGKTGAPPAVASLTATTDKIFAIDLNWSFPAIGAEDTAYTEIWSSPNNSFSSATQQGTYSYPTNKTSLLGLASGYQIWFWARLVDTSGNVGPWYPSSTGAGVEGASSSDATAILSYLNGQITESQLGSSLLGSIQAIQIPDFSGDSSMFSGDGSSYAGEWTETDYRQEADLQLAQKVDTLAAVMGDTSAAVQVETATRVTAQEAQAEQITTIQASTASNSAAVQTNATAIASTNGTVSSLYTVKVSVSAGGQSYMAGIGIGAASSGGTLTSQVYVAASQFAVIDPNGSSVTTPFVIQGGQTYINQALIGTGWITNAMIGQTIQSTTVGANGQPLWVIDKANGITFNGANGGSGYLNLNNSTMTVYDQNGTLRVRAGIW